ncbi:MAG TPA: murein biosynthesis integral membrane protein MurJ [Jiangellaceae bacterium]|nr:murein biosynthesis integral membrane protein MurJ [Jiangellaceae bacterium]
MSDPTPEPPGQVVKQAGLLSSSAVMAAGTVVSRLTGFARAAVIAAAIGLAGQTADAFNLPNTIPNMIYILVAGGVLNAVLVPALVRAIKEDADGGQAYSQRLFSLVVVILGVATVVAVVSAPWLMRLFVNPEWLEPANQAYFDNVVMFARFCLPQIFFYGLYVLVGQMMNARGRFGPMMWAPIVNNIVAIAVFGTYLAVAGQKAPEPFTTTETLVLGLGSTLGVALQALVLIPVLLKTGFRLRFRTDWRGAGLGTAGRLGFWTLAFVVVNQVAYVLVIRTASGGSVAGEAGVTVYTNAMLIMMVPHAVITVSLATALLPRLADHAADGNLGLVRDRLVSALRICLAVMMPMAALLAALAVPLSAVIFGYGAASGQTQVVGHTLAALVPGLIAFTVHYVVLRGFYSMQDTRTPFVIQIWIAVTMVVNAMFVALAAPAELTTVLLAAGYSLAYVVGATISVTVLGRRTGVLGGRRLVGHIGMLAVPSAAAGLAAFGLARWLEEPLDGLPGTLTQLAMLAVGGTAALVIFGGLAYLLRIAEIREAAGLLARRVRSRRSGFGPSMEKSRHTSDGDTGDQPPKR